MKQAMKQVTNAEMKDLPPRRPIMRYVSFDPPVVDNSAPGVALENNQVFGGHCQAEDRFQHNQPGLSRSQAF